MPSCAPNRQTKNHRCVFLLFFLSGIGACWSESARKYCHAAPHTIVIASETKQSSQLCTHANACDFIMTGSPPVTAFPREDKKHRAKFPSMEGCRAAAGWFIHQMILCYLMSFPSPLKHPYIQNILDLFSSNIDYLLQNLYFWFDRVHIVNRFW